MRPIFLHLRNFLCNLQWIVFLVTYRLGFPTQFPCIIKWLTFLLIFYHRLSNVSNRNFRWLICLQTNSEFSFTQFASITLVFQRFQTFFWPVFWDFSLMFISCKIALSCDYWILLKMLRVVNTFSMTGKFEIRCCFLVYNYLNPIWNRVILGS